MESNGLEQITLGPGYSTREIPGKCIKCLAEKELDKCIMELLRGDAIHEETEKRFEMLIDFLKSPGSQNLRNEAEKLLSEGKHVKLKIYSQDGETKYELEID